MDSEMFDEIYGTVEYDYIYDQKFIDTLIWIQELPGMPNDR